MEKRSRIVTATVIAVAAMIGLGAGVTTALVGKDDATAADGPETPIGSTDTSPDGVPSSSGTTSTTEAETTGTPSPAGDTVEALYYADGVIHDGETTVDYQPRFQSTVSNVSRVAEGWVVKERFGSDGARLVLVAEDGSTTPVDVRDPHWYAVSPGGDALAAPNYDDPNQIDFVDTSDGGVFSTLTAALGTRVVNATFTGTGDDLLVLGDDVELGQSKLAVYHADTDRFEDLQSPPGGAGSRLVGSAAQGTRVLVEYLLHDKPCVAVLDLTADARPLWKSCQYRPLGAAGVSPDAESVALAPATAALGTVTDLTVADATNGLKTGSVRISSGYELIDASWADPTHLVVQGSNEDDSAETIDVCSVSDGCEGVPEAGPDNPADDVAPGS
jgi:hypothetical protein